jgi:hypothetical protein
VPREAANADDWLQMQTSALASARTNPNSSGVIKIEQRGHLRLF